MNMTIHKNYHYILMNVTCGLFTKLSCDRADSLQMMMRCRNVISKEYYICVTTGPGRSPLPNTVYPTYTSVEKFLIHDTEYDTTDWPEEFKIPMDMGITRDPTHDTIKVNNMAFISHYNYIKQVHVASYTSDQGTGGSEYLLRILLYMRDAGFKYGGNIYTKSDRKESVAMIKEEKKEFTKERKEIDLDENHTCSVVNTKEYHELNKKTNKSKDDMRKILQYRIRHRYQVDNVPKWLFKLDRKHSKEFIRLKKYIGINGITDRNTRNELQNNIRSDLINVLKYIPIRETVHPIDNSLTSNILLAEDTYNAYEDIAQFWTERYIEFCENALKILELIGAETFMRNVPRFDIPYNESNKLQEYIVLKEKRLREFINDSKKKPIDIDKLASKVTKKAFGITFKPTPTGCTITN